MNWSGWIPYLSVSGQSARNGMVGYGPRYMAVFEDLFGCSGRRWDIQQHTLRLTQRSSLASSLQKLPQSWRGWTGKEQCEGRKLRRGRRGALHVGIYIVSFGYVSLKLCLESSWFIMFTRKWGTPLENEDDGGIKKTRWCLENDPASMPMRPVILIF